MRVHLDGSTALREQVGLQRRPPPRRPDVPVPPAYPPVAGAPEMDPASHPAAGRLPGRTALPSEDLAAAP